MLAQLLLVGIGGAVGAIARFGTSIWVRQLFTDQWPLATLLVNVLGSFGLGVAFVLLERGVLHADARSLIVIGFFGAFTTFSTFSLEMLHMLERGQGALAASYAGGSLLACLAAVAAAVFLTRLVT